ncbi:MAG TPA: heme-binding protein [Burkholderiaceae bacterium]
MNSLNLDTALAIAQQTLAEGRSRGFAPLTAAVLDAGGHVVALLRADGSSLLRPQIATGKAWGALGLGFGGRELAKRAAKMPAFFNALSDLSGGHMVPVPGGVLIREASGALLGAIGVSGDTSDNDELCAIEAVRGAGLVPDTGAEDA